VKSDLMRSLVIVVDMQRDFVMASGALPVPDAEAIVAPAQAWLAALDPVETAGVLFTFDTHDPAIYAGSPESEQFPIHCIRGTAGWETMLDWRAIDARIPVHALDKGVFDMWAEPDGRIRDLRNASAGPRPRDSFFADLKAQGITRATVIGVAADYCVRWAVDGLIARGFAATVPAALTRGITRDFAEVIEQDFAGKAVRLMA
ncbi:MAG: cysteine hydrolase family protein, partial [Sphingomonadaceae bacterium]